MPRVVQIYLFDARIRIVYSHHDATEIRRLNLIKYKSVKFKLKRFRIQQQQQHNEVIILVVVVVVWRKTKF